MPHDGKFPNTKITQESEHAVSGRPRADIGSRARFLDEALPPYSPYQQIWNTAPRQIEVGGTIITPELPGLRFITIGQITEAELLRAGNH